MPITIYERDIEEWAAIAIKTVTGEEGAFTIGRQITLPSGKRLDLLAGCWFGGGAHLRLYVIEVKSEPATPNDLVQLAGYVHEVRLFWGGAQVRGILLSTDLPADVWQLVDEMPDFAMAKFHPFHGFSGADEWEFCKRENDGKPNREFISRFDEPLKQNTPGARLDVLNNGRGEPA